MLTVPFFALILLAILFPRFVRFILTLVFFGVLLLVASFIDHASAQSISGKNQEMMVTYASSFAKCSRYNIYANRGLVHQTKMLNGNVPSLLIMSCSPVADEYVRFCMKSGREEPDCYGDLKLIADDVLQQIGE